MRIFVDSGDSTVIRAALASGYVYGVTTNPSILRRAGVRAAGVPALARTAVAAGAQELHLQTYAEDTAGMVRDARALVALDPARVVVKIPATPPGYAAAAQLAAQDVRVTLTAVYTVRQAILAGSAGARYIAVYLGRMRDAGLDALGLVGQMQRALAVQHLPTVILAASVRDPVEVEDLALLSVATVTLPPAVLDQLLQSPATAAAAATFSEDARAIV
jgi:transaldolase